jgi:hypothetical protein
MASVGVRSPYFFYKAAGGSVKLDIYIDGVLEYSILKNVNTAGYANFEIAELIRDYVDIYYTGVLLAPGALSVNVWLYYTTYTGANGTGTASGLTLETEFEAFDGYAYYTDEEEQFIYPSTGVYLSNNVIWSPQDTTGFFYYALSGTNYRLDYVAAFEGTFTVAGETMELKRFPCNKYTPVEIVFVNRYGMLQQLWFFTKSIEGLSVQRDEYKSNALFVTGAYQYERHQVKNFDVNGKTRWSLNTGYISEDYNESMKELMLSEQVWAEIGGTVYPVNVTSSDVSFKTTLNDKLVAYSLEIEQANDLISTMR